MYPLSAGRIPAPPLVKGALYGVAVWGISYLGWVPGLKLLRPATTHPGRRNLLMILAHLVWGPVTAVLAEQLQAKADQGTVNPD